MIDPSAAARTLQAQLGPWHDAINNPTGTQAIVLHRNLGDYAKTNYGMRYGAASIDTIEDYRRAFPTVT